MKVEAFATIILFITITGCADIVFRRYANIKFQSFYNEVTETWYQCIQRCFHYSLCEMVVYSPKSSRCHMYPVNISKISRWIMSSESPRPYLVNKNDATKVFTEHCANYSCPLNSSCEYLPQLGFICTAMNFTWTICTEKWVPFLGRCLQIKYDAEQHADAEVACGTNSAELVSVFTTEDEELIVNMTSHYSTSGSRRNDSNFRNKYWITTKESSMQTCFVLNPNENESIISTWPCSDKLHYVCERKAIFTNFIQDKKTSSLPGQTSHGTGGKDQED